MPKSRKQELIEQLQRSLMVSEVKEERPAATLVVWTFLDIMRSGKPTAVGAATA